MFEPFSIIFKSFKRTWSLFTVHANDGIYLSRSECLPFTPAMSSKQLIMWSIKRLVNLALIVGSSVSFRFTLKYFTIGPMVVPFIYFNKPINWQRLKKKYM